MQLIMPCMECVKAGKLAGAFTRLEFRNDDRYDSECPEGHKSSTLLQQQRFELLFDVGAYAVLDGYYREAVLSFFGSLERFYEFALRALLLHSSKTDKMFKESWKLVAKQSERQLGAFIFVWASKFNEAPEAFPLTSFRNDVVHKGTIPTRVEAIEFGDAVLAYMRPKLARILETFPEEAIRVTHYHLGDRGQTSANGPSSTTCIDTIISISAADAATRSEPLSFHLQQLAKNRAALADFVSHASRL